MQITIDTKKDTPEDIKRAIQLLQHYLNEETPQQPQEGLFSMFNNNEENNDHNNEEPGEKQPRVEIIEY